ncbi:MAG TPA: hypothetical protein VJ226_05115 [Bradyrhizobium sp.]|nr:hypothetical protein [Bradyrhizobium sp.]
MDIDSGVNTPASQVIRLLLNEFADGNARPPPIMPVLFTVDRMLEHGKLCALSWLQVSGAVRTTARFYKQRTAVASEVNLNDNVGLGTVDEMAEMAASFATLISFAKLDAYFIVGEFWVAPPSADPHVTALPASVRSDRREVVIVSAADRHHHKVCLFPVLREDEDIVLLGDAETTGFQTSNPLLLDLFAVGRGR